MWLRNFLTASVVVIVLSLFYNNIVADAIGFEYRVTVLNAIFLIIIISVANTYSEIKKR